MNCDVRVAVHVVGILNSPIFGQTCENTAAKKARNKDKIGFFDQKSQHVLKASS